jgi:hypothetical protein
MKNSYICQNEINLVALQISLLTGTIDRRELDSHSGCSDITGREAYEKLNGILIP